MCDAFSLVDFLFHVPVKQMKHSCQRFHSFCTHTHSLTMHNHASVIYILVHAVLFFLFVRLTLFSFVCKTKTQSILSSGTCAVHFGAFYKYTTRMTRFEIIISFCTFLFFCCDFLLFKMFAALYFHYVIFTSNHIQYNTFRFGNKARAHLFKAHFLFNSMDRMGK